MLKELISMYNEHYCAKKRRTEQYQELKKVFIIKMNNYEPQLMEKKNHCTCLASCDSDMLIFVII